MNKTMKPGLLIITLLFTLFTTRIHAQAQTATQPRYKDVVVENPDAEADMKVVMDYVNLLTSGDVVKAPGLIRRPTGYAIRMALNLVGRSIDDVDPATPRPANSRS